jgi:hypothetical protein
MRMFGIWCMRVNVSRVSFPFPSSRRRVVLFCSLFHAFLRPLLHVHFRSPDSVLFFVPILLLVIHSSLIFGLCSLIFRLLSSYLFALDFTSVLDHFLPTFHKLPFDALPLHSTPPLTTFSVHFAYLCSMFILPSPLSAFPLYLCSIFFPFTVPPPLALSRSAYFASCCLTFTLPAPLSLMSCVLLSYIFRSLHYLQLHYLSLQPLASNLRPIGTSASTFTPLSRYHDLPHQTSIYTPLTLPHRLRPHSPIRHETHGHRL